MLFPSLSFSGEEDVRLWPFFLYASDEDSRELDVLWPLFSFEGSPERKQLMSWPLYNQFESSEKKKRDYLWPLVHSTNWKQEDDHWYFRFFPFVTGSHGEMKYHSLVPVYYWSTKGDDRYTHIITPFYQHRHEDRFNYGILPLLFTGWNPKQTYFTAFPAVFLGKSWTDADREELKQWYFDIFPILWSGRSEDKRYSAVLPFFLWITKSDTDFLRALGPFFYHRDDDERDYGVFPIFWSGYGDNKKYLAVLPLFVWFTKGDTNYLRALGPLFYRRHDDEKHFGAFPLLWMGGNNDDSHFVLFPLIFTNRHYADADKQELDSWYFDIFPFLWTGRKVNEKYFTLFPLIFSKKVYSEIDEQEVESCYFDIFPLLWTGRDEQKKHFTLFPVFSHKVDHSKQESKTGFLYRLFHHKRKGDHRLTEMLPFWSYERDPQKKHFSILWRLYASHKEEGNNYTRFLYFIKIQRREK
jgi:hypothetical protein